jgi:methylthioribose-1-phosphate isomerase
MIKTIEWSDEGVVMIDQRLLPTEEVYNVYASTEQVAEAIRTMVIRGAPALGVAAAMGIALGVKRLRSKQELEENFEAICRLIHDTRPTARNLFWGIERMRRVYQACRTEDLRTIQARLIAEARLVHDEDIEQNRKLGHYGQQLLSGGMNVLTHCNAGALATAGYGTALGVIRSAIEQGKELHIFADETRPFLQGARLTAWELAKDGIPCTLITDNMAGYFMKAGRIQAVVVGADRIAKNGDTANKIGTYSAAVLAREHGIPFYVAAPISTVDMSMASGDEIPIEERDPREVSEFQGKPVAPEGIGIANPAFDVTPARFITAIITDRGIARPPFEESLAGLHEKETE